MDETKKLFLIDGNAILHRAFYAMPPFRDDQGRLVNAVYGFASMILTLINTEKPDYLAVSFDLKGKTFRHEEYKEYKATRQKAPDELYTQLPIIKELVTVFQIPIYELQGFEADDVLGTLSTQASQDPNLYTYIVTGDMDALQLVKENVKVLSPVKGFKEHKIYDVPAVLAKHGLKPTQVTDLKGLQGDSSDNIKGVAGIGPKTAKILLQKYGSIENIYQNLPEIKDSYRRKLEADQESAFFSKRLATIVTDAPITLSLQDATIHEYDLPKIETFFIGLKFNSLIRKLQNFHTHYHEKKMAESGIQASLF